MFIFIGQLQAGSPRRFYSTDGLGGTGNHSLLSAQKVITEKIMGKMVLSEARLAIIKETGRKTLEDLAAHGGITNGEEIRAQFKASLREATGEKIRNDFYGNAWGPRPYFIWAPRDSAYPKIRLDFDMDKKTVKLRSPRMGGVLCEENIENFASVLVFANEFLLNYEKIDKALLSSDPMH